MSASILQVILFEIVPIDASGSVFLSFFFLPFPRLLHFPVMANRPRKYFPATTTALEVLGEEIRAARKSRGYSEERLAKATGCSRDTIRAIEKGLPSVEIGLFFEAAARVGLIIFGSSEDLLLRRARIQDRMKAKSGH